MITGVNLLISNIGTVDEPMNDQYTRYLHNNPNCNLIFHSITKDSVMQIIDSLVAVELVPQHVNKPHTSP